MSLAAAAVTHAPQVPPVQIHLERQSSGSPLPSPTLESSKQQEKKQEEEEEVHRPEGAVADVSEAGAASKDHDQLDTGRVHMYRHVCIV